MKKQQTQIESRQLFSYIQQQIIDEQFPTQGWTQSWTQIQNHIFTYICAQQTKLLFAYISNKIRQTILNNKNIDIIQHLRKQIATIFYKVFNTFVQNQIDQNNPLKSFMNKYIKLMPKLKIVTNCLYLHMSKFMTRGTIQKQINQILIKQLMKFSYYQQFVSDFICLIQKYRDLCLVAEPITKHIQLLQSIQKQFEVVVSINMFTKIYPQYLDKSKKYYCQLLNRIPKNIQMFTIIQNYIHIQTRLKRLLPLSQNNYLNINCQQQNIIAILCKQVIDQLYTNMIQYLDYLITNQHNKYYTNNKQNNNNIYNNDDGQGNKQQINEYNKQNKQQTHEDNKQQSTIQLQYIWNIIKVLTSVNKNNSYISRLNNRLIQIFWDLKKYIKDASNLYKLIDYKQTYHNIIVKYFDDDYKLINILNNTIQEVLMKQQSNYNSYICSIILHQSFIFYQQSTQINNTLQIPFQFKYIYALFKLTPSKQLFIRKFQQQFSKYVLVNQCQNLSQQQKFIKTIHKQCGNVLCKNIDRMIADVWKNQTFINYNNGIIFCRVLSNDWPTFTGKLFNLPDALQQIRIKFQQYFLDFEQNDKKKLQWIPQCGIIKLKINQTISTFSQLQASIVIILNRSFRPMKIKHLCQVLNYEQKQLNKILKQLVFNNIIIYQQQSSVYELNLQNNNRYQFKLSQKYIQNKQKDVSVRDYSILIQAHIARIMKRKKIIQKTDLMRILNSQLRIYRPDLQQINRAIQKLKARDIITIQKIRGMIRYIE